MSVHIFRSPASLAAGAAKHITSVIHDADRTITLGLSGGTTPAATHRELAASNIDWGKVVMWLGDERWVPHDHKDSNTKMARATLVDPVVGRLLAPDTAFGEPAEAAAHYATRLVETFYKNRPDLVILGMGDDGHTASLFPGTEALETVSGTYLANWVEQKESWRLTASMPTLWSAREIVFLVQGEGKARVLSQIIDDGVPFPAQRVAAGADTVCWMVDSAAASQLRSVPR